MVAPHTRYKAVDVARLLGASVSITARIILLTLSIALGNCAQQPPMSWVRTDSKPVVPTQIEADQNATGQ